jgi:hypothetical protein
MEAHVRMIAGRVAQAQEPTRPQTRVAGWWFAPMPRGRAGALRTILYGFIFVDVLVTTSWVPMHGDVPGELYRPLLIGRLLPLPTPGPVLVSVVEGALLLCAAAALWGRWPRLAGAAVFALYLEWMVIAFSYGKVNHDRFAIIVALAVLPTVGRTRWRDRTPDEAAGWALRCIQVAVVLTYLLATLAKLRYGGLDWVSGSTLMRAVLRRGTSLADPLVDYPWVLYLAQYGLVAFELASPLLLWPGRVGKAALVMAAGFHAVTWAAIKISFLPHVVCLLAFVPLERLHVWRAGEALRFLGSGRARLQP